VTRTRPGADLAIERVDDVVYLARLPDGPIYVLEGSAAAIWDASLQEDDSQSLVSRVAALFGQSAEEVETGTKAFLEELVRGGLLVFEG
jgi:hypothetical protein